MKLKNLSASEIILGSRIKWDSMFDNEQELIDSFIKIDVEEFKRNHRKGYAYIESFQKQVNNGKELSPKQITQLKRLAVEIYRYHKRF